MRKRILALILTVIVACPTVSWGATTQVDSLIEKLMEKGILSKKEARELKMEIAEDAKAINEDVAKTTIPEWVQNTKLKGDARIRYQYERAANDTEARTRGRARLRLGLESKINPKLKVGAGLATSEVDSNGTTRDDARSTNMTFNDSFARGDIRMDYVFAEYQPVEWFKGIAGKFTKSDYLWTPTDMLWDTDINPAGASAHFEHKIGEPLSVFLNSGAWVIDENGKTDRTDPYLMYGQGGAKLKQGPFDATLAGVYYGFAGVKATALDGRACSNTDLSTACSAATPTALKYDYDSIGTSAEFGIKNPTGGLLPIPRLAFFGDFIHNLDSGDEEDDGLNSAVDEGTGWATGFKIGDEKVNGQGQWQWKYQYTNLGKDAFPDAFPDSDRYGGRTDVRGHEVILEYGLTKNVILGLDYYQDQRIKAAKNSQKLIQADLNIKF